MSGRDLLKVKIAMRITSEYIRNLKTNGCKYQVCLFDKLYPQGVEVTVENIIQAMSNGLDVFWLVGNDIHFCKEYLYSGFDINFKDKRGNTALMKVACNGKLENIKILISAGADINAKNNCDNTAIIFAVAQRKTEFVKVLISAGADINAKNRIGENALTWINFWDNCIMV
jgi:hypothetical protein